MYKKLTEARLKTGETMEVDVIIAPDEEHADKIKPFLGHKGGGFMKIFNRTSIKPSTTTTNPFS